MTDDRAVPESGLTPAEVDNAHQVWRSSRELGTGGRGLASLGQGTVALLAGFDLTTVVLLTTSQGAGAAQQAAIACFGVSAALFILALAFITSAEDYAATPEDRLIYYPEARVSEQALETQRGLQRQDDNLLATYFNKRILPSVTLAVLGTLAGLALVLLKKGWSPGLDVAAIAVVVVALIYLVDWRKGSNWWLFPRPVLPGWTRRELAAKYSGHLSAKQEKRRFHDEMLHLPVPKAPMSDAGRRAMLGSVAEIRNSPNMTIDTDASVLGIGQAMARRLWIGKPLRKFFG
jgi:hypothetical protein